MPEIIAVGTSQIVFRLDGMYAAKTSKRQNQDGPLPQDYYVVNYEKGAYSARNELTFRRLRDLGFNVPEHHYFMLRQIDGRIGLEESGYGRDFVITPDLSESGRFKVEDVEERHFRELTNGADIER